MLKILRSHDRIDCLHLFEMINEVLLEVLLFNFGYKMISLSYWSCYSIYPSSTIIQHIVKMKFVVFLILLSFSLYFADARGVDHVRFFLNSISVFFHWLVFWNILNVRRVTRKIHLKQTISMMKLRTKLLMMAGLLMILKKKLKKYKLIRFINYFEENFWRVKILIPQCSDLNVKDSANLEKIRENQWQKQVICAVIKKLSALWRRITIDDK